MTLTLVVAWLLQRSSEDMRRARFEQAAAQIRHELEERVESASSILRATAALFSVDEVRSRREFREYVERLNVPLRYPGMLGVGYIQRLRHQDYQRLTASAGGAGSASFAVWPPGRRDEYYPVMLLEPRDQRNRAALGYDIATDPVRRAALEEAIQSGHPTLTGPLSLVQEITGSRQVGVLLLVPIYAGDGATRADAQRKQALKGLAYAPIRIGDLVDGLGSLAADDRPMLAVYDGPAPSPTRRLYPSQFATPADAGDRPPGEALSMSLTVAGRQWLLVFNPQPRAWRSLVDPLVAAAACTGSLVSLVLYWGARRLVRSRDEADARAASLRALERERRMVLDAVPAMIWYKDRENRILRLNQAAADSLNQPVGALEGRSSYELYPEEAAAYHRDDLEVIATGKPKLGILEPYTTASGEKRIVRTDKIPSLDEAGRVAGVIVFSVDVTEVKRTEEALHVIQAELERRVESRTKELEVSRDRLIEEAVERHWAEELTAGSARILEQVASPAPLAETLDALVRMVESQAPDMLGSVLLLDASGTRLRCAAAARLPDAYNAAIDGVAIGPAVGSCGTAAYAKRTVIVEDIAVDPLWADYRDLALQHGLRACWSAPILSSGGRALGTFAMYYRTPRRPGLRELELIRTATHLARLAIEHKHAEQESRAGEARFRQVVESAPSGLLVVKADGSIGLVNEQVERMFGYARNQLLDLSVEDLIPERYREGHTEFRRRFMGAPEARSMGAGRELFARRKDGSEFPVEVGLSPIEHDGAPAILCSIVDVTSRRGLEEQAREQHMALSQAMPGIARLNAGGEYEFVNDFYAQMVGYQPSEMVGAHFSTTLHPEDLPIATAAYERLGKEGKAEFEARAVRKDGRRFYKQVLMVKRVNATGHYIGHHCFMRDITARRQAEEERVRHLEQQAVLYELASALSGSATLADVYDIAMAGIRRTLRADRVSILRFDADGVLRFKASQGLSETYKLRVEGHSPWAQSSVEAQPICIVDVAQEPSLEAYREAFAAEGIAALGFIPLRSPDRLLGKFMLYYDTPHRFTDAEIHLAQTIADHVATAIQRNRAHEALSASEARYRALYEQIPSMYVTVAPSGAITSVNRYGAQHLGYEPEELLGRSVLALFHPEDQEAAQRTLDDAFAQPGAHHAGRLNREFRKVKKDGTVLWVRETARILPAAAAAAAAAAADSEPLALIVCQDVTEAKEAEDALVESESRFRQMAESIQEVFWLSTPDKNEILYVSPAYEQIWGRSCRSLYEQPRSWLEAIHPDDRDRIRMAASVKQADGQYRERYRVLKPDGTVRWIEDWAFPVRNEVGQVTRIAGLATDITERVEAEEAARRFHDELERLVRARTADLDQTRGLLQEVIDSSPDWIFVKDRAHRFLLANRSFAMSQGIAPETMIGRPDTDFWSAELCDGNPEKGIRGFHADDREAFEGRLAHNPHDPATLADGTLRIFDTYKGPLRNERGEVYGVLAYCRDVTEQQAAKAALQEAKDQLELRVSERTAELTKVNQLLQADIRRRELAEAALRQSEQSLRDLYDVTSSPGLSFRQQVEAMLDVGRRRFGLSVGMLTRAAGEQLELNIVRSAEGGQEFNGQMVPLCGGPCAGALTLAEPLAIERWGDSEFREHPGHLMFGFESYLGTRVSVAGEPYGTICFMSREGRTTPFNEADRTFLQLMARWIGAGLDRQRAEDSLRESEQRLRTILDAEPECVKTVAPDGTLLTMNAAGLAMLEADSPDQLLGRCVFDVVHPEDREAFIQGHHAGCAGEAASLRFRVVSLKGAVRWMETRAVPLRDAEGGVVSVLSVTRDITSRKQTEDSLRESEARYRRIVETATEGIWMIDAESRTGYVNAQMAAMLGWTVSEMIGRPLFDFMDDEGRRLCERNLERRQAGISEHYEFKFRRKDGADLWALLSTTPILDRDGGYAGALAMVADITELRAAMQQLQDNERRLRAFVEAVPDVSFVLDEDGRYLEVLTPDERLLLRPAAELRGRLAQEVLPPDLAELCVGVIRRTVETGRVEIVEYAIDLPGGRRWFEGRSSLMSRLPGRKATVLFMARDITDRVRAAEALKDAGERQRALSRRLLEVQEEERRRLAMDLHDEVGQALTAIKINLLAAQRQGAAAESGPAAAGDSLAILDDLTHRVRDLSLDLRPASLDDLGLAEAVRWLGERQAERAGWALRLEVEEDLADVSTEQATACYRVVQEALTNILRHAGASRVEIGLRRLQDTLHLQICDDGRGFDPQAGGQGLGLLTMQERVKHVGGEWAVVTAPGAGTEIRVAIPVAAPVAARTNQEGES